MTSRRSLRPLPLLTTVSGLFALGLPASSPAATEQYWNPGGTGGDGIWGTSPGDKNWNTTPGAPTGNISWPDTGDDVAVFQDSIGGIVTVFDPAQVAGIKQDGADYAINAGTITLVPDAGAADPFIDARSGTLSIDSVLDGSSGLIKSGSGDLVLSTANLYTGTTAVQEGVLTLTGSLVSDTISISSSGSLLNQSGGFVDNTTVTLSGGGLTMNSNDTVETYTATGGRLFGGSTLTVTNGITLSNTIVSANLRGDTTVTGDLLVNGSIGGGSLTVDAGSFLLTGSSANLPVTIAAGASLTDVGGLANAANVTNAGTLTVNANDTINSYTSNGGTLGGLATLTATNGATLNDGSVLSGKLSGDLTTNGAVAISGLAKGGELTINNGVLTLTGTFAGPRVDLRSGELILGGDNIANFATLEVDGSGTVTVNGDDTVGATSIAGTVNGPGTLTASNYTLRDGAVINGNLGEGTFTKADAGTVTINGTLGSDSVVGTQGTIVFSGDNLEDTADLATTAPGIVQFDGNDTVGTYTSVGGTLTGAGTLTATNGATLDDGSTVSGHLRGNTTTNGMVLVSGTLGGGNLSVDSGMLTLTGTSTNTPITIAAGATLVDGGDLLDTATLTNAGRLTMLVSDTIGTYTSNGGLLDGTGTLITAGASILNGTSTVAGKLTALGGAALNGFSTVTGLLTGDTIFGDSSSVGASGIVDGNLTSVGPAVLIEGMVGGGALAVSNGTLTLTGSSTHNPVTIAGSATLIDNGDLADNGAVTNVGTLQVNTSDKIDTYVSNGSTLSGSGLLIATGGSTLNNGSIVSGSLTGDIETSGSVLISGEIGRPFPPSYPSPDLPVAEGFTAPPGVIPPAGPSGGSLNVTGGTLTITGSVLSSPVTIQAGATVIDQSAAAFPNFSDITNHGLLVLNDTETVRFYDSSAGGALQMDVTSPTVLDRLIAHTVTLDPGSELVLESSGLLLGQVADLIDGAITGTFDAIKVLSGPGMNYRYSFNPNDGTIQAIPGPPAWPVSPLRLFNLTRNQTQVIGTAFDDVHLDPRSYPGGSSPTNFRQVVLRDTGNPDPAKRWKEVPANQYRPGDGFAYDLDPGRGRAPVTPGTQAALLGDAITTFQSGYDVLRDASGMPMLDPAGIPMTTVSAAGLAVANLLSPEVHQGMADFTVEALRTQVRMAMDTPPVAQAGRGSIFAAAHFGTSGATSDKHNASYNVDLSGAVAGVRYEAMPGLNLGVLLGGVDGDIEGNLVDTDGSGVTLGLFAEYLLEPRCETTLTLSLAYGDYEYDAVRHSFGGDVKANDVGSDAFELALGIETVAFQRGELRLVSHGTLRYLDGDVDGFTESGPGVQMDVDGSDIKSVLLEIGVDAEVALNERAALTAQVGFIADLEDDDNVISGSYVGGGRPVSVFAPGLDDEAVVFGLGTWFNVTDEVRLGMNWRSEFRGSSENLHVFGFSGSAAF